MPPLGPLPFATRRQVGGNRSDGTVTSLPAFTGDFFADLELLFPAHSWPRSSLKASTPKSSESQSQAQSASKTLRRPPVTEADLDALCNPWGAGYESSEYEDPSELEDVSDSEHESSERFVAFTPSRASTDSAASSSSSNSSFDSPQFDTARFSVASSRLATPLASKALDFDDAVGDGPGSGPASDTEADAAAEEQQERAETAKKSHRSSHRKSVRFEPEVEPEEFQHDENYRASSIGADNPSSASFADSAAYMEDEESFAGNDDNDTDGVDVNAIEAADEQQLPAKPKSSAQRQSTSKSTPKLKPTARSATATGVSKPKSRRQTLQLVDEARAVGVVDEDEEPSLARERPKRNRFKPLKHWCNESVEYERSNNGISCIIPVPKGIRRPDDSPEVERKKARTKRSKKVKRAAVSSSEAEDEGEDDIRVKLEPVNMPTHKTITMLPMTELAQAGVSSDTPVKGIKSFEESDFTSGLIELLPRGVKHRERAQATETFFVHSAAPNSLRVAVEGRPTIIASKGSNFFVKPNQLYSLENTSDTKPVKIYFQLTAHTSNDPPTPLQTRGRSHDGASHLNPVQTGVRRPDDLPVVRKRARTKRSKEVGHSTSATDEE